MTRRSGILGGVMLAVLLVVALWSAGWLVTARAAARVAAAELKACRDTAAGIRRYRRRPTVASQQERLAAEVTGLIEAAATSAGVTAEKLVRITPEPPQRLGDTAYKEKPTHVLLRSVSLKELVGLVHNLLATDKGLHDRSLRITAPRRDDTGSLWTVELVITYLIYDPPRLRT